MAREPGHQTDPLDRVVAELEALRPEEFVGARDQLARTLRQRGDRAAAARISRLRRPSLSVWAANRLSRALGGALEQLLELGAALQEAQQAVMAGEAGAARRVRELAASERHHVAHLAEEGRRLLVESGYQASQPVRQRLATTLHAAAATAEGRAALAEGRLTQDLDPPGFGDDLLAPRGALLGGVPTEEAAPAAPPGPAEPPETAARPTEDVQATAALRAAVEEARRAEQAAAVEAVAARRVADQARAAAESARARAGALQLTAGELRRAADELARRAADAEEAARQAVTEADQRAEDAEAAAARAEAAAEELARAQEARQAAEDAAPAE